MECVVLKEEKTLWNLQRLYLNNSSVSSLYGKFAIVSLCESEKYICRIYQRNTLHSGYCILDQSVEVNVPGVKSSHDSDHLLLSNVKVIPGVKYIKTVTLSIVFFNPQDTIRWKEKLDDLCSFIKELLQLYVLVNNCVVNMDKLDCAERLRIRRIVVHSIGNLNAGKVVDSTKIKIESLLSQMKFEQMKMMERVPKVVWLKKQYMRLKEILRYQQVLDKFFDKSALHLSSQILIIGPSGCGKKSLVKQIASDLGVVLITLDGTEATKPDPGDTEIYLKKIFQEAVYHTQEIKGGQCILLLLNLEALCKKSGRIMLSFLSLLDSVKNYPGLVVIGTASKPHLLHRALQSSGRFHTQMYIGIPTEPERKEILQSLMSDFKISDEELQEITNHTPGFILADLVLLVQTIYRRMMKTKNSTVGNFSDAELMAIIYESLSIIEPSSLRGELGVVHSSDTKVKQLGGLERVKLALNQAILWPLLKPQAFKTLNIQQTCGVLLYGPPGCAKTSLVCSIAASYKCTFLAVSAADLYSPYVGDAEKTIAHLFQRARAAAPTILFIDEIDALVGSRGGREKGSQERVLSSFLTEMDGVGVKLEAEHLSYAEQDSRVFVVAATNRPNVLDSALLRPGRFDRLIYVPSPNTVERLDILTKLTERMPLDDGVDLKVISEETKLYSGADLNNLCREAALIALTEGGMLADKIEQKHWAKALLEIHPSLTHDQVKWYNEFRFNS